MKIAITTPTGHVGGATARALLDAGHDVTLIARHPDKVADLQARGARVVQADQEDREQVIRATEGVDALFWVTPPNFQARDLRSWQGRVTEAGVAAARLNRIPWVVVLSSIGAQHARGTGPIAGLHDAEKAFESACRNVLHLRPTFFMENYGMHLQSARQDGHIYMPAPASAPMYMIAADDIGAYAAERLGNPGKGRGVATLLGPDHLTFGQAAATIGEALKKPVQHVEVTPEQAYGAMTGMGLGESTVRAYLEMYDGATKGLLAPEDGVPVVVTKTPFLAWCRKAVGA